MEAPTRLFDDAPPAWLPPLPTASPATAVVAAVSTAFVVVLLLLRLLRRRTYLRLSSGRCNLPTVLWRPKFVDYSLECDEDIDDDTDGEDDDIDDDEDGAKRGGDESDPEHGWRARKAKAKKKKMASSSITGMLPRMERLGGQYGMYGTVYGLNTAVVHVAHPIPARLVLTGEGTGGGGRGGKDVDRASLRDSLRESFRSAVGMTADDDGKRRSSASASKKRRSAVSSACGAVKSPAYDHFKNFSGDGVFTADGDDWRAKRASVMHCLLKGCTNEKGEGSKRLEREANRAASAFGAQVERERRRRCEGGKGNGNGNAGRVNIVPLLQRSTIGLIYRFITHHDIDIFSSGDEGDCGVSSASRKEEKEGSPDLDESPAIPRNSSLTTSLSSLSTAESTPDRREKGPIPQTRSSPCEHSSFSPKSTEPSVASPSCPTPSLLSRYLTSVTNIRMIILAQSRSVWFLLPRWVYRTFSPLFRREERCMGPIREFASAACDNAQKGSPLALLRARDSHQGGSGTPASGGAEGGTGGSISKDLMDEAITLLFAGQDTSAATLSWTLHLLSLYPDVQRRAADEVRRALEEAGVEAKTKADGDGDGDGNGDGNGDSGEARSDHTDGPPPFITKRLASRMTYLDAVVKESMRLYPVAPFVVRKLPHDVVVPAEKRAGELESPTVLPAGTLACVWIYALHRNPRLWDRPDDFVPERWIDPELRAKDEKRQGGSHGAAYIPFAAGPRNCLGRPLAQVVLRILLSRVLAEYEVVEDRVAGRDRPAETLESDGASNEETKGGADGHDDPASALRKDMQAGFTVLPSGGVRVSMRRRIEQELRSSS